MKQRQRLNPAARGPSPAPDRQAADKTARGSLLEFEERLLAVPAVPGFRDALHEEFLDLPTGLATEVAEELLHHILELRPAHTIGDDDCDCEAEQSTPYLLAWSEGQRHFVRELTDHEARLLQDLCLAEQAAAASPDAQASPAVQRRFWD